MQNIELKIKVDNFKDILIKIKSLNCRKIAVLNQLDTYFNCFNGRFKLREINNKKFELIFYRRTNQKSFKVSQYEVATLDKKLAQNFKYFLSQVLGVKVVVKKRRISWLYKKTRIFLDEVTGLGKFLELETVVGGGISFRQN
jgi:adenylate cyclase class IV